MPIEKSAGAVIFRRENKKIYYLLLHYEARHWDFPKGHIEKGESEEDALRREVFEETGIKNLKIVPGFRKTMRYFFKREGKTIMKTVVFYLAETKTKRVRLSFEHIGYKWLPYIAARKQLTFKNAKDFLQSADKFLIDRRNHFR